MSEVLGSVTSRVNQLGQTLQVTKSYGMYEADSITGTTHRVEDIYDK